MSLIKPSIGRIVHYFPRQNELNGAGSPHPYLSGAPGHPMAAIITAVHSDRMVNLSVFDGNGQQFGRTSVTLVQEGDREEGNGYHIPEQGYCEWMPYQIGQAQKTEELEKQLSEKD
jgi:hypothetical protein